MCNLTIKKQYTYYIWYIGSNDNFYKGYLFQNLITFSTVLNLKMKYKSRKNHNAIQTEQSKEI